VRTSFPMSAVFSILLPSSAHLPRLAEHGPEDSCNTTWAASYLLLISRSIAVRTTRFFSPDPSYALRLRESEHDVA